MQLAFIVDPVRNWLSLWKPAIDALGNILGSDDPLRFHPRDDRIVKLALHRRESPTIGWRVGVGVWWRPQVSAEAFDPIGVSPETLVS